MTEDQAAPSAASRFADRFFRTAPSPSLDGIRATLWNDAPTAGNPPGPGDTDTAVLLEQYKLYAEMADRVSERRGQANAFFLSVNTTVAAGIALFAEHSVDTARPLLIAPWLILLGQCLAWFWLLRSYRQLNSAKFAVIGALEERLPASPYWRAEWAALGGGTDPARYWPLSHVEQWVPWVFALAYTAGFVGLLFV
ncbi:hypothetical protein KIH74_25565 [Kineosporia sp. J2-2]|uniref:Small integral membrane protein n=1 Tax=Kineosporia corallincola TaxID=2835133 RepID=A0ABS5TML2_9ACTN|nr:hypothetical protein [Kineosporia corallincola]MBT0772339.1 hypothetical protein [Kineosporia corallincola]